MKNSRNKIRDFFRKYGSVLCSLAILASVHASDYCRTFWYEPEVPEGFEEFVKNIRK